MSVWTQGSQSLSSLRYAGIEGIRSLYLVEEVVLRALQDLVREANRKAERDADSAERAAAGEQG